MVQLVLASASPARLATLRSAGIEPQVQASDVAEEDVPVPPGANLAEATLQLARAKAEAVAERFTGPVLVLGCDSILELDGDGHGKPLDPETARRRWRAMRGRSGVLHTGHWLMDLRTGRATGGTSSTVVHFANLTDAEIDAYVATGEPLQVAGAFTVDGRGGPFITGIEGDYHGVVGLSLPLLRDLLAELGVAITDLWRD